jgi:hypothetical protein
MKTALPTDELRYGDMSQFYPLKAALEQLLGHRAYLRLKETATLRDWKEEIQKLIRAIKIAIESTVEIADGDWFSDIDKILELGKNQITTSKNVTALFANLSAMLVRLVFLQIGFLPLGRQGNNTVRLTKDWWTLNYVRTIQYVQNSEQRHKAKLLRGKRARAIAEMGCAESQK